MQKEIDNEYKKYKIMSLIKQIHQNIAFLGKILKDIKSTQLRDKTYDPFINNLILKIDYYFRARELTIFEWHENILSLKKIFDNDFIMIMYEKINDSYIHNTEIRIKYKKDSMKYLKTFFNSFIEMNQILIDDYLPVCIIKQ